MADIRINALPTTATDFASDDYIAIDGTTNGTRKLNAKTANLTFSDVTLGTSGPSVKSSLSARAPRQGLVFDGTAGATVSVPALGTADYTFAIWINPTSLSTQERRLLGSDSAGAFEVQIDRGVAGSISIIKSNVLVVTTTGALLTAGKQQLVTITRTGTSGVISINGVQAATFTDSQNYTIASDKIGVISTLQFYYKGGLIGPLVYNRALSASEVVALYEAGAPSGADYNNASNTSLITGDNSTFASDTGYWTKSGSVTIGGGNATFSAGGAFLRRDILTGGKRFRLTVVITANTAADGLIIYNGGSNLATYNTTGTKVLEIAASTAASPANSLYLYQAGAGGVTVDTVTLEPLGLLLAPDAAQAGGGLVWYDTSGNNAFITLPASGVRWNVPSSQVLGGNWTTSGNLTVSGGSIINGSSTSVLYFGNPSNNYLYYDGSSLFCRIGGSDRFTIPSGTGNFLIGTTTDSGNGKLQLATHTTSAGGIGFGTDTALYRGSGGELAIRGIGNEAKMTWNADGTIRAYAETSGTGFYLTSSTGAMYLRTNGYNTALTLDSSQNATFAGHLVSYSSGASADQKYWSWQSGSAVGDGVFRLRALNDAGTNGKNAIVLKRTGISSVIVNLPSLPTSSAGLVAGDLWNDSGTVKVV